MSDIHSCSYYCDRPACIKAQRDDLRDRFQVMQAQAEIDAKAQRIAALQHSGEPVVPEEIYGRICGYTPGEAKIEIQLPASTRIGGALELGCTVRVLLSAGKENNNAL
jgi:hypothetical protein